MNQKVAKGLRKEAYGENTTQKTTYSPQIRLKNGKPTRTGAIVCNAPRNKYLLAKKMYKEV